MWMVAAALAQDPAPSWGVDTHGRVARPDDGGVDEGLYVGSARLPATWTLSALAHGAHRPALLLVDDVATPTVGDLAGLDLRLSARFGRLGVAAALPTFGLVTLWDGAALAPAAPRLGDVHVWLPVAAAEGDDVAVLVTPWARLPTGGAWTGDRGPSVGATTTIAAAAGLLRLGGEVGVHGRWREPLDYAPGAALVARLGARVGVASARVGVHAELGADLAVLGRSEAGVASPVEAGLTARYRAPSGWSGTVGAALGLTRGLGAPDARVQIGIGYAPPRREAAPARVRAVAPEPAPLVLTIVDEAGRTPDAAVTLTGADGDVPVPRGADGWSATVPPGAYTLTVAAPGYGAQSRAILADGQPLRLDAVLLAEGGTDALRVAVVDPEGQPIDDAQVRIDGRPVGGLGDDGALALAGVAAGPHAVEVTAEGYRPATLDAQGAATVALDRLPGSVRVVARTGRGRVLDAVVRFEGVVDGRPVRLAGVPLGDDGDRRFVLRPGLWQVIVASPSYGLQQRAVEIRPDETALSVVEFVLQPDEGGPATLTLRLVDPDGAPVDGVGARLDGREVGRTASGGTLVLAGLDAGPRELTLDAGPAFRPTPRVGVVLHEGPQERLYRLDYVPGVVRVRARTPERPVPDGTARFSGPAAAPALPLGPTGVAETRVGPGAWDVVVASPTLGLQRRDVTIAPDERRRVDVDVVLGDTDDGPGGLRVRVTDPDGQPVGGAAITVDGARVGTTSNAGTAALPGVDAGRHTVTVDADARAAVTRAVTVGADELVVDVVLPWGPGAVRVIAQADGAPVADAFVRVAGPAVLPPRPLDERGERTFGLAPGAWQVVVVSPSAGLAQAAVTVRGDERARIDVPVVFTPAAPDAAVLLVRVEDGAGAPIPGASVAVGGATGATGAGGAAILADVGLGQGTLLVSAEAYVGRSVPVSLDAGLHERIVVLDGVPVPVEVAVVDAAGGPVDAALVFEGPIGRPGAATGPDGLEAVSLPTGLWTVIAAAPGRGAARADVAVKPPGPARVTLKLRGAKVDLADGALVLREPVRFAVDSARPGADAAAVLDEAAAWLLARPDLRRVEIQGHTDATGNLVHNLALSEARAQAVMAALVARGVPAERLVARGYGATRPVAGNEDEAGRAANRRVQLVILERAAP